MNFLKLLKRLLKRENDKQLEKSNFSVYRCVIHGTVFDYITLIKPTGVEKKCYICCTEISVKALSKFYDLSSLEEHKI
jgi:hypothetical protein